MLCYMIASELLAMRTGRGLAVVGIATGPCTNLKIHQRGVQWKQGVVVYIIL